MHPGPTPTPHGPADAIGHLKVRLVGYGEVGRILAEDLRARGIADLAAFDPAALETTPSGAAASGAAESGGAASGPAPGRGGGLRAHAQAFGVRLAESHRALVGDADLVICAVTASQTVPAAAQCAPAIRSGAWYLDFNSASPAAKQEAGEAIDRAGARYVEAAVMTSIPPYRIRVPMLLGGRHATGLLPLLSTLGFAAKVASDRLGVASATKMCRSVMIKGLEAMVIESFTSARAYGVEDQVIASLAETFPGIDWERQAAYFFQRVVQHGRRRAEEMREAARTVREIGLEPWSAAGTAERQAWLADLTDAGVMGERGESRTDWRIDADRILGARGRDPG